MADFYGPAEMLRDFKNIRFQAGSESVNVAINNYRNNGFADGKPGNTKAALAVKDGLLGAAGKGVMDLVGGATGFVDVFTGKGSPQNIGKVLQALYTHREKFKAAHGSKGGTGPCAKVAGYLADSSISWQVAMQKISDDLLGLDCNGFVGNWMKAVAPEFKLDGSKDGPRNFYNARKQTRKTMEEIEYWDVIIWENMSHIAAIHGPLDGFGGAFYVCQSAGGGPRNNLYWIDSVTPGKFKLTRVQGGGAAQDVGGTVYVVSHWPA